MFVKNRVPFFKSIIWHDNYCISTGFQKVLEIFRNFLHISKDQKCDKVFSVMYLWIKRRLGDEMDGKELSLPVWIEFIPRKIKNFDPLLCILYKSSSNVQVFSEWPAVSAVGLFWVWDGVMEMVGSCGGSETFTKLSPQPGFPWKTYEKVAE